MRALIIANGTVPSLKILRKLVRSADVIICADGGANHAKRLGISPDLIIGDFDSILSSTKKYFKHTTMILAEDQYSTDLEKAISYCVRRRYGCVDIVGATGDRIDHSTGSLGCFKKFGSQIQLRMIDSAGELSLIYKSVSLKMKKGDKVSLIPLERCTDVSTKHLLYPLRKETLELGVREGISNEATASMVRITVGHGTLLLYRFHQS